MNKQIMLLLKTAGVSLIICVALCSSAYAQVVTLDAEMSSRLAIPLFLSPASGAVRVTVDESGNSISVEGSYSGLSGAPTSATIVIAPSGILGPAILTLQTSNGSTGRVTGESALTASEVQSVLLGDSFILIKTASFPNGELRGLIRLNGTSTIFNGVGLNPSDSLTLLSGSLSLGLTAILGVDNTAGTQAAPAIVHLGLSATKTSIIARGFGMSAVGSLGEALIYPVKCLLPYKPWTGPGKPTEFPLTVPVDSSLVGATVYFQAFIYEPLAQHLGFTNGLEFVIGSA